MGACPERLVELAHGGRQAAVIANATDAYPPQDRTDGVQRELDALRALGFEAEELDLRPHFDDADIKEAVAGYDVLWVRGGNVFTLRHALAASDADRAIVALLHDDALVYAGYSAGPCVLAPNLEGLDEVDDPTHVTGLYGVEPLRTGLGVLDHWIVPHVSSPGHPESPSCDRLAARYRQAGIPHRALRDGEVLIVDGDSSFVCAG
jgi:dipeptidase E